MNGGGTAGIAADFQAERARRPEPAALLILENLPARPGLGPFLLPFVPSSSFREGSGLV
jgi:hypothetical protein